MKLKGNTEKIKKRMIERGMGVNSLAQASGISINTVRRILAGEHTTPYTAKKISYALIRSVEKLFVECKGGDENG